ncbi:MAG: IPT/TIG domain-containing protein [Coriobacteriia bacterium]|nr:IPT/TIG domain-containing protein [Coriobacteriia bacterium]
MLKGRTLWLLAALLTIVICFAPGTALAAVTSVHAGSASGPSSSPEGTPFTLYVIGTGFGSSSQVTWTPPSGSAITLARLSQTTTQLTASVPATAVVNEGASGTGTTAYRVSVTGTGAGGPLNFLITEADTLTVTPVTINATSGATFSGTIANLSDTWDNQNPSEFTVGINWGDGSATDTAGTVTRTGVGTYSISGSHTYTNPFLSTTVKTATTYPASTIPIANNGTTNFASSGSLVVFTGSGYQTVSYTGKTTGTSASFTGVTGWTGSGTLAVGNPVTQQYQAVTVAVTDPSPGTASSVGTSSLTVADGTTYLMNAGPFSTTEGQTYTGSSPFFPGSIYTGAIFPTTGWYRLLVSNGSTSAWYTLYTSGPNNYMYPNSTSGSVVFPTVGQVPYSETLYLNNGTPVASAASTVTVNDAGLSYYSAVNTYHTVEASSTGTIQVGKFLDSYIGGGDHHGDFTCTIHWGDGSTDTSVPAVYVSSNTYTVSGSHTYSEEGTYTATYDVADVGGSTLTGVSTAIVAVSDPSVVATGVAPLTTPFGTPLGTQVLATFTDPAGPEANDGTHYAATIDWGGSFGTSDGVIDFADGTFTVSGDVPYSDPGTYSPTVTINHEASTPQTVTDSVVVQAPITNDIVPSTLGNGSITPDTTQTVVYGSDSPTFTITPGVGSQILDVVVDGISQGPITSYQFTNVTAPHTISAIFAIDTFDIVPSAGAGGSISPSTTQTVDYGSDSATFTITPDANHHIADVLVDGVSQGPITSYQFTNVGSGHTISASFAIDTFDIVPSAGAGGSISPSTTQTVDYGSDSATFTIAADVGHHLVDVQVDGVSQGVLSAYKFTGVTAGHTISATFDVSPIPSVTSLSTYNGAPGTIITITGTNFGSTEGANVVTFGGFTTTALTWSDTQITVVVPDGALEGYVGVWRDGVCSNGLYFIPFDTPVVTSISPDSGPVGSTVTISGSGFGASEGSGVVTFGGVTTTALTWSDTTITVAVPPGAPAGYVGVWQHGVCSNGIFFTPGTVPAITGLSTSIAPVGTTVVVTGSGFGASQGNGKVTLAGETCAVQSWSDTSVTFVVPADATAGYVGVWNDGGICSNGVWLQPVARIDALSNWWGAPSSEVTITGAGFGATQGSNIVTFGGVTAAVVSWSDTAIVATVPASATAGYVGVWTNGFCSNGIYFLSITPAVITNVDPGSASIGSTITVTGTGFGASQGAGDSVTVAGVTATITNWSDTSITAQVPVGATTGYVGVWKSGVSSNGWYMSVTP